MITLSYSQLFIVTGFFASACLSLIIYIYKNQTKRIDEIQKNQDELPINKMFTSIEKLKTDVAWIKEAFQKKN